jgi:hypothetical protein
MKMWREWVEEHWAGLGVGVSVASALTISILLSVAFNVFATR